MIWNVSEDFINPTNKAIQKVSSYKQIIPSTDLSVEDYALYLQYASAEELERDIVKEKTYMKILRNL